MVYPRLQLVSKHPVDEHVVKKTKDTELVYVAVPKQNTEYQY